MIWLNREEFEHVLSKMWKRKCNTREVLRLLRGFAAAGKWGRYTGSEALVRHKDVSTAGFRVHKPDKISDYHPCRCAVNLYFRVPAFVFRRYPGREGFL